MSTVTTAPIGVEPTLSTYTLSSSNSTFTTSMHAGGSVAYAGPAIHAAGHQLQLTDYSSSSGSDMNLSDVRAVNDLQNASQHSLVSTTYENREVSTSNVAYLPDPINDDFEAYFNYYLLSGEYSYEALLDYVRRRLAFISGQCGDLLGVELIDQLSRIILDQCLRGDFDDMYAMLRSR